jgi:1-acyl-sn-glycerol-3-phosphate acyltransferase
MDHAVLHERARRRGVNPLVYLIVRALVTPFSLIYLRMDRFGRDHIPAEGPVIIAANHRSFLDPFVIGTMTRRPMYYVAKKEIFRYRWLAWLLGAVGAFPVDRGAGDVDTIETAKAILARGEIVLIFPEGTRIRPGTLGRPRRGVGRLALETGAPVVPVAVTGTDGVRRGVLVRPRKVRVRAGRALHFPRVEQASPALAGAVTDRIWPCVMLQWEWLGGQPPIRRVAVIGAGRRGTAIAAAFSAAGCDVALGCRTQEQSDLVRATRVNERSLPGVEIPANVAVVKASKLDLDRQDLICIAVPARALPGVMAAYGERIPSHAGILVLTRGLVPPLGTLPSAFATERCRARAIAVIGGTFDGAPERVGADDLVIASADRGFARQLRDLLSAVGRSPSLSADVTGVELAGCARTVAVLAAGAAARSGVPLADGAAGSLLAELDALARARGARPETLAGLAAATDSGAAGADDVAIADSPEAVDSLRLLASYAREASVKTPALDNLAALVEGRLEPHRWAETFRDGSAQTDPRAVRAA